MFVSIFLWSVLTLLRIFCLLHVVETACRHRWGCTWIESRNPEFSVGMNLASLFRNETGIDCWIKSQVWALNSPVVVKRGMSFEAKLLIQAAERTLAFKRLQPSRFLSSEPPQLPSLGKLEWPLQFWVSVKAGELSWLGLASLSNHCSQLTSCDSWSMT